MSQPAGIRFIYLALKRQNPKFLHDQMEPRSPLGECRTSDGLEGVQRLVSSKKNDENEVTASLKAEICRLIGL